MKNIIYISVWLLLTPGLVAAHEHNLAEAKELIDDGVSCSELNDDQLEIIGEYIMEQIHPGEQHEGMDGMMGGEGSGSLREMHISIAQRMYCGEGTAGGMMMGSGMMGGGMIGGSVSQGYGYGIAGTKTLLWIGLLAVIGGLGYSIARDRGGIQGEKDALGVLKERYARGEIQRKEYLEMREDLERR